MESKQAGKWTTWRAIHGIGVSAVIQGTDAPGDPITTICSLESDPAGAEDRWQRGDRIVQCANAYDALCEALLGAQEELRLIRMKDTITVYDTTLKMRITLALAQAESTR